MTIEYHTDLIQGSDEWLAARRGIVTASEVKLLLTPTLRVAGNEKSRAHILELAAQRISGYVEPHYVSDDMLRGQDDEIYARMAYVEHFAPVNDMGFITNDKWGFKIGYSPDGLVGENGLIEIKSRRQKFQVKTFAEMQVPEDYILQIQTGLLVSEREWLDFISYCGGLPMFVLRAYPDENIQAAILEAVSLAEEQIADVIAKYEAGRASIKPIPTKRRIIEEMYV